MSSPRGGGNCFLFEATIGGGGGGGRYPLIILDKIYYKLVDFC